MLDVFDSAGPLLILGVVILVGVSFGALTRRIGLPGVTGQILGGVCIGRAGLDLFDEASLKGLEPLTQFALGLIAVTVGAHLNIRRLRNAGRRLFFLLLTEATILPLLVFASVWGLTRAGADLALLLAAISIATAPATIVALVKETRAKGVFVKTLIAAVALNNMACIVLFEVARSWAPTLDSGPGWAEPTGKLLLSAVIGGGVALAMQAVTRLVVRPERFTTAAIVALVLTSGLASSLDVSPLLACLVLGIVQTNLAPTRDQLVDSVFANFEPAILAVFFTIAGMHLSVDELGVAGWVALVYFLARIAGKLLAAHLALRLAQATQRVRRNLGSALVPQAGVAVGLVIIVQADPTFSSLAGLFSAIVLTTVAVNEIVGPILTRRALLRSGEAGHDRMRLIDFLQEEHIETGFRAASKEEAIEKLVDLMLRTHSMPGIDRTALLDSVSAREREASTCLGGGLAVPHGILPEGCAMVGVMAISREGLDFPTPDGRPVHCMVLLGTSPEERARHLQVLAVLARRVGTDAAFQKQLFNTRSAAHAYEILHGEAAEDFNYFLEESS
ncbi:MAG: cation:proton antiporter [Myxococcota bacterium]|nr:cation:proton antiporter [Myxococcota bacterium]